MMMDGFVIYKSIFIPLLACAYKKGIAKPWAKYRSKYGAKYSQVCGSKYVGQSMEQNLFCALSACALSACALSACALSACALSACVPIKFTFYNILIAVIFPIGVHVPPAPRIPANNL